MTYEEAKEHLKKLKSFHNGSYGTAVKMAIATIDKQIPMKPLIWHTVPLGPDWEEDWGYACPSCGGEEIDYPDHHCACGQKLDWSDCNE